MAFNSWAFAIFFAVVFVAYYLPIFRRTQPQLLIVASILFYLQGSGLAVVLLLLSILANALISRRIFRANAKERWILMIAGVIFNIALLIIFKYDALLLRVLRKLLQGWYTLPQEWIAQAVVMPIPLGVSFYCFEGISLVVDTWKKKFGEQGSRSGTIRDTSLFISFFPHLISGPILRAEHFFPQIGPKQFGSIDWYANFKWIVIGYFLKVFVGDNLAAFDIVYPNFLLNGTALNLALLFAYSARIFADFAGYSFVALGLAGLLGYSIPNNFNAPYISRSLSEFWRRWHISLSAWLRDYLFVPLGGSRGSKIRAGFNVLLVMFLGGLWHGESWTFAFWGTFHGLGLFFEHLFFRRMRLPENFGVELVQLASVFSFVTVGWLGFIFHDIGHMKKFVMVLFRDHSIPPGRDLCFVGLYALPVVLFHLWYWAKEKGGARKVFVLAT